jgi:hypothetical protein
MQQAMTELTGEDDKYLREIAAQYLALTIEELALVLTHPVTQDDAMRAAHLVPELMDRVYEAVDSMPSPLTQEEEAEAIQSGARIAGQLLAKATKAARTPLESACACLAALLHKPMKVVEAMCVGWSDPSLHVAMAGGGGLELKAKLCRGAAGHVTGQVTLNTNPFGVGSIRGNFDRHASVTVALFDIPRKEVVPFGVEGEKQAVLVIKAGRTKKVSISLPATVRRQDFLLVAMAPQEDTL